MKKVSILMAVYHPNLLWLKEQIVSLEKQTYPNLELWIIDDGSDSPVGEKFFSDLLQRIPYHYRIHEKNRGSDQTFSELADWADGDYFAFCDQDDIWLPTKLEELIKCSEDTSSQASYCLLSVINENGKKISDDIRTIRKADFFPDGDHISIEIFRKNCIYGCSMILCAEAVKQALPVPESVGYDHWFSLWASLKGRVSFLEKALVEHRLHGDNQSTPFKGIKTKEDYYRNRIRKFHRRVQICSQRFSEMSNLLNIDKFLEIKIYIDRLLMWAQARELWYWREQGSFRELWKNRSISKKVTYFELLFPLFPNKYFKSLLKIISKYFV